MGRAKRCIQLPFCSRLRSGAQEIPSDRVKKREKMVGRSLAIVGMLFASAIPAWSQSTTSVGALDLKSTIENVSVRASFVNDSNANNNATVEYRKTGSGTWLSAYSPIIDRRTSIAGNSNAEWSNEARTSIVGLTPATSYDVRVTWSDPDGVSGGPSVTGVIRTFPVQPPLGGAIITVNDNGGADFASIPAGLAAASPGDTVRVTGGGPYPPFTLDQSGTATAYLKLEAADGVALAGGPGNTIELLSDYVWIDNFTFHASGENSIEAETSVSHFYLTNTVHEDIAASATTGLHAGVKIRDGADHVFVLNNYFNTNNPYFNIYGVYFVKEAEHTFVIAENVFEGAFRDAAGGEDNAGWNSGPRENADFARNTVASKSRNDDGVEFEGANVNVRIWDNFFGGASPEGSRPGIAVAPSRVGPLYIYRNVIDLYDPVDPGTGVKLGNAEGDTAGEGGFAFFFHNTFHTGRHALTESGGREYSEHHTYYNNIFYTNAGRTLDDQGRSNKYDYNLHHKAGSGSLITNFNGSTYATLADLRSAEGVELHGIEADPKFINSAFEIDSASPARDAGVLLPNFNDAASAWPYRDSAPDIGAFEYGGAASSPPPPPPPPLPDPDPGPSDTNPPTVTLSSPPWGATVSGAITVSADAVDDVGVAGVQFAVGQTAIASEDTVAPYSVNWDTQGIANGSHTLSATARDVAGNVSTSTITIIVENVQAQPNPDRVTFANIGDYGNDDNDARAVAAMLKAMNPDFFFTNGDNNYPDGEASTWDIKLVQHYGEYIDATNVDANRFYLSWGNHDWNTGSLYLDGIALPGNERYYDIVKGPVHLFAVDSDRDEPDGTSPDSIQGQWLRNALASSTAPWKVVYFHHPPYSSGDHGNSSYMQWPFEEWGADLIFAGHDHDYERILRDENGDSVDGVYIVNGAGGASIRSFFTPVEGSTVRYNGDFGGIYGWADANTFHVEFHSISEGLIDSFSLSAATPTPAPPPPVDTEPPTISITTPMP